LWHQLEPVQPAVLLSLPPLECGGGEVVEQVLVAAGTSRRCGDRLTVEVPRHVLVKQARQAGHRRRGRGVVRGHQPTLGELDRPMPRIIMRLEWLGLALRVQGVGQRVRRAVGVVSPVARLWLTNFIVTTRGRCSYPKSTE